jgi:hypothetical protein
MDEKSTIVPISAPSTESSADAEATRLMLTLRHQSAEIQELRRQLEALDETLQQRTRRVSQLIGERDQLAALLAQRDEESRQLNRELGAQLGVSTPRRPFVGAWSWLPSLDGIFAPLGAHRHNTRSKRRAAAVDDATATTELPLIPKIKDQPSRPMLGVAIFGLAAPELNGVLQIVDDYSRQHGFEPLLLTDSDAFEHFRARRLVFEYLPPADSEMLGPELDWQLYTQRRLALIRRKWQPVRVISFGRKAAEVVELWCQSPFEAEPLPTVVGKLGRPTRTLGS